jgi:UDP-N-acetylmuramoylalanine--D-glutamate ligase
MNYTGKKVLVIGTGLSGIGAAQLLSREGAFVTLLDQNEKAQKEEICGRFAGTLTPEEMSRICIVIGDLPGESNTDNESPFGYEHFDQIVPSPAVPLDSPLLQKFEEEGTPIISEIELGSLFEKGKIIAITGTNGKTTTTTLVGEIMKAAAEKGLCSRAFVVGNIGSSYAAAASETDPESVTVGEISSFQLEAAYTFKPTVSAILNITPDHLNRHYTMQNYAAIKERIAFNQTKEQACVLNYEDPYLRPYGEHLCPARVIWFSSGTELRKGYYLKGDDICRADGRGNVEKLMNVHDMQLVGVCNAENVMAAIAITEAAGVPTDLILSVIREFPHVPHRIEFVGEKGGVKYYNDSKATNPDAAIQGIRAMTGPTVLIGGGYDKKNSYDEWIEAFAGKVKKLVLIGQTRDDIADCARAHGFTDIVFCDTFEECMKTCTSLAEPGDEILLSPACASWGMFPNYEVRGDIFRDYVRNLPE